jgi:nicotinamide-nucleotide amidase
MSTIPTDDDLQALAAQVGDRLHARHACLATAESCTGGWVAKVLTDVPGSSSWFERGFVTYSNEAKQDMLGVPGELLHQYGAVSEATVRAMAEGALDNSRADHSLAITGIAGPGGGTTEKPVGYVWVAWAGGGRPTESRSCRFKGERADVRRQSVVTALNGLLARLPD